MNTPKQTSPNMKNYDSLECPFCGDLVKPKSVKNDTCKYPCTHCDETFFINPDGDLVDSKGKDL